MIPRERTPPDSLLMAGSNNFAFSINKKKIALVSLCGDRNMNDVILTGIMPSENTRCSRMFSPGTFPVEMALFIFLPQYSNSKAISKLFYKITKGFFFQVFVTSSMSLYSYGVRVSLNSERK